MGEFKQFLSELEEKIKKAKRFSDEEPLEDMIAIEEELGNDKDLDLV